MQGQLASRSCAGAFTQRAPRRQQRRAAAQAAVCQQDPLLLRVARGEGERRRAPLCRGAGSRRGALLCQPPPASRPARLTRRPTALFAAACRGGAHPGVAHAAGGAVHGGLQEVSAGRKSPVPCSAGGCRFRASPGRGEPRARPWAPPCALARPPLQLCRPGTLRGRLRPSPVPCLPRLPRRPPARQVLRPHPLPRALGDGGDCDRAEPAALARVPDRRRDHVLGHPHPAARAGHRV